MGLTVRCFKAVLWGTEPALPNIMELPARRFKAASRTERGALFARQPTIKASGTERGVFFVRDGVGQCRVVPDGAVQCRADWHRIVSWSPRGSGQKAAVKMLVSCSGKWTCEGGVLIQTYDAKSIRSEVLALTPDTLRLKDIGVKNPETDTYTRVE